MIFTQKDGEGWFCQPGDRLDYTFEKYPSSVVEEQSMAIGIIKDGVLYESDAISDLSGHYSVDIEEAGEYYIYLIGASSDYLALKEGSIAKR